MKKSSVDLSASDYHLMLERRRRLGYSTKRQSDILKLAALGNGNKEIANALGISEQTVKNHFTQIFVALGARDRTHAVILAMFRGDIDPVGLRLLSRTPLTCGNCGVELYLMEALYEVRRGILNVMDNVFVSQGLPSYYCTGCVQFGTEGR